MTDSTYLPYRKLPAFSPAFRRLIMPFIVAVLIATQWTFAYGAERGVSELPIQSEPFHFDDGGNAPSYHLTLGSPTQTDVAMFFISGSGCATVKNRLPDYFAPIRDALDADLYVLQKRGVDENKTDGNRCSDSFRDTDHFDKTLADQQTFIQRKLAERIRPTRAVVLIGASEGAVVAAKIASGDPRITHLGLIGGGGPVRENLRILSADTWYLRNPESGFADIAAAPMDTQRTIWGQTYRYWSELLDVDIGALLLGLDIPIVMAMGEQDRSVPIGPARQLEARFTERGKHNFELLIFSNSNHRLEDKQHGISHAKDFLEALVAQINTTEPSIARHTAPSSVNMTPVIE